MDTGVSNVSHHWACSQILHKPHKQSDEIITVFTAADQIKENMKPTYLNRQRYKELINGYSHNTSYIIA